MRDFVNLPLLKAENPEAYKKLAEKGLMVGHPVKIAGQDKRPDIGIAYHTTIKFFNPEKDSPDEIHSIARKRNFEIPDPRQTKIEPGIFKDRLGNDVYVLKLHGSHTDKLKEHNAQFSHLGYPAAYEFQPHVSVDKATWQKIVDSNATTAHEAGIEFGPAKFFQGNNILATYHPNEQENKKLAASEKEIGEPMQKGAFRSAAAALGITASLMGSPEKQAVPSMHPQEFYSSDRMLNAIADVESSGGKFVNHRMLNGMHDGEKAYGRYGLTPVVIRETINMHRDLKDKHKKAIGLKGADLHHYMQDNPGLEDEIASKHLQRLEHHFGKDPVSIGHAWLEGITGTHKAKKNNEDIDSHWHVKKIKNAYLKRI